MGSEMGFKHLVARFLALFLALQLSIPSPAGASPELSRRTLRTEAGLEAKRTEEELTVALAASPAAAPALNPAPPAVPAAGLEGETGLLTTAKVIDRLLKGLQSKGYQVQLKLGELPSGGFPALTTGYPLEVHMGSDVLGQFVFTESDGSPTNVTVWLPHQTQLKIEYELGEVQPRDFHLLGKVIRETLKPLGFMQIDSGEPDIAVFSRSFQVGVERLDPPTLLGSYSMTAPQDFMAKIDDLADRPISAVGVFHKRELHWVPTFRFRNLQEAMQAVLAEWRKLPNVGGLSKAHLRLAYFEDGSIHTFSGRVLYVEAAGLEDGVKRVSALGVRGVDGDTYPPRTSPRLRSQSPTAESLPSIGPSQSPFGNSHTLSQNRTANTPTAPPFNAQERVGLMNIPESNAAGKSNLNTSMMDLTTNSSRFSERNGLPMDSSLPQAGGRSNAAGLEGVEAARDRLRKYAVNADLENLLLQSLAESQEGEVVDVSEVIPNFKRLVEAAGYARDQAKAWLVPTSLPSAPDERTASIYIEPAYEDIVERNLKDLKDYWPEVTYTTNPKEATILIGGASLEPTENQILLQVDDQTAKYVTSALLLNLPHQYFLRRGETFIVGLLIQSDTRSATLIFA